MAERNASKLKADYERESNRSEQMRMALTDAFRNTAVQHRLVLREADLVNMRMQVLRDGELADYNRKAIREEIKLLDQWMKEELEEPLFIPNKSYAEAFPKQAKRKMTIRALLKDALSKYEAQLIKEKESYELYEKAAKRAYQEVSQGVERYISTGKALEKLRNNDNYTSVMETYETAVTSPIWKAKEFAMFRETHDRVESAQITREYRQLFMSLMYTETNEFKAGFPFGEEFSNKPEENKKDYPYLYELWLDRNGAKSLPQKIANATEKVATLKAEISPALEIDPVLGILLKMEDLPNPATDPKTEKEADNRIAKLKRFYQLHETKHNAERPNEGLGDLEKDYENNKAIIQIHLNLAKAQKLWINRKTNLEKIDKQFTAEHLREDNQKQVVMEMCLLKFKKAKEIVDSVFKGARLSENFNPAVKRLLIALIYKNGVGEYIPATKDKPLEFRARDEDYATLLREILLSDQFNTNQPGEILSFEQINFLTIAIEKGFTAGAALEQLEMARKDSDVYTETVEKYANAMREYEQYPEFLRSMVEARESYKDFVKRSGSQLAELRRMDNSPRRLTPPEAQEYETLQNEARALRELYSNASSRELPDEYKGLFSASGDLKPRVLNLRVAMVNNDYQKEKEFVKEFGYGSPKKLPSFAVVQTAITVYKAYRKREVARAAYDIELANDSAKVRKAKEEHIQKELDFLIVNRDYLAIRAYLKDPKNDANQAWLNEMVNSPLNKEALEDAHSIEVTYSSQELDSRGAEHSLELLMGIEFETIYQNYEAEIAGKEHLSTDHWMELLNSPDANDRQALIDLMKKIVPADKRSGKFNFIFVLENIRDEGVMGILGREGVDHNDPEYAALAMLGLIKTHIERRRRETSTAVAKAHEYEARLRGKGITDHISGAFGEVWRMATGPGSKPAERIAAIFAIYLAYKGIRKAFGDNPGITGNVMKYGILALVADMVKKRITGKGIFESLKTHSIDNAFKGTNAAAYVKYGCEIMESGPIEINEEQHHETLRQIKKVPFHKLMEWYEFVGGPPPGKKIKPDQGKDPFKKLRPRINTRAIFKHNKSIQQDSDLVGRTAVYKAIQVLCSYAGNKQGLDQARGLQVLQQRWVDPIQTGNYDLAGKLTKFMPVNTLKRFKDNPQGLTWEIVSHAEMRPQDALDTIDDDWMSLLAKKANEIRQTATDFTRTEILAPTRAKIRHIADKTKYEWGPEAIEAVGDLVDAGATKLYWGKDYIEVWYDTHKLQIRRFVGSHVELAKLGIALPFEIIIAADKVAIDWVTKKIKGFRRILIDRYGQTEIPLPLLAQDLGPEFYDNKFYEKYLGSEYAEHFQESFNVGESIDDEDAKKVGRFYIDPDGISSALKGSIEANTRAALAADGITDESTVLDKVQQEVDRARLGRIGYYTAEITADDVDPSITDPQLRYWKMMSLAEDQARLEIKRILTEKGERVDEYDEDYFDDYLYAITQIAKVGSAGPGHPEKLYVFYRMPLADSKEVLMKKTDKWADTDDPRNLKDHPPFSVDPTKSTLTNLAKLFERDAEAVLEIAKKLGVPVGILIKISTTVAERLTGLAHAAAPAGKIKDALEAVHEFAKLEEATKQNLDEFFGTGATAMFALSDHYGGGGSVTPAEAKANREAYFREG